MGAQHFVRTVADVLDWYEAVEVREFSPVALAERRRLWTLFRAAYGTLPLADCRPVVLLEFIAAQKGCRSNWTRRRLKATICKPFNEADTLGLIPRNPFRGLRIPAGKDGRDWTQEEYRAILRVAPPYSRRLIVFLRLSGGRPGEARTLRWSQIRKEVRAIVQGQHKTAHTSRAPRRIHFNGPLLKLLAWLGRNKAHPTFVFVNRMGRPWTIRALCNHMAILRKRAGLPDDVRTHGARHTFGTNAVMNGVDLATLAQLMGHASVKTTERYVHLAHKREWLNAAMEKAIGHNSSARD